MSIQKYEPSRGVEIRSPNGGSGYRIGGNLVLTASHVLFNEKKKVFCDEALVRLSKDDGTHKEVCAEVVWIANKAEIEARIAEGACDDPVELIRLIQPDIALIRLKGENIELLKPVKFGRFPKIKGSKNIKYEAFCYPASERRPRSGGKEATGGRTIKGNINLEDRPANKLLGLNTDDLGDVMSPRYEQGKMSSWWSGASGAAIVCDGLVVAVMTLHPNIDISSRLEATPLSKIYEDKGWLECLKELDFNVKEVSLYYKPPSWWSTFRTTILVAIVVTGFRFLGGLQWLELIAYDILFSLRPTFEEPDDRIAIVEIKEEDLSEGESEVSDRKLRQILASLVAAKPSSIGLDIYRDEKQSFPGEEDKAQEDYDSLVQCLTTSNCQEKNGSKEQDSPPIFVVCRVTDPNANERSRHGLSLPESGGFSNIGFSNIVVDEQGSSVRRQLLSMRHDSEAQCKAKYFLGYQLALDYLKVEEVRTDKNYIQLKDTVFEPVWTHTGGYRFINDGGYQILLNYRKSPFNNVLSAEDVLNEKLKGKIEELKGEIEKFKDDVDAIGRKNLEIKKLEEELKKLEEELKKQLEGRIVLVGYNVEEGASEIKDLWRTPIGTIPGVRLHAYTASHILSTVIKDKYSEGHPLIKTWAEPEEILVITFWCAIGGCLLLFAPSRPILIGGVGGGTVLTIAVAWGAFAFGGWWLPVVPMLLGFGFTSLGREGITIVQRLNKS